MQIAVIGNGPSAKHHAERWQKADIVVRCNVFAGDRCDIWASHFDDEVMAKAASVGCHDKATKGLWMCIAPTPARLIRHDCQLSDNAQVAARGLPVQQMTDLQWLELICTVTSESRPTTGACAIRMALEHKPDELILAGFDATQKNRPGWGNSVFPWGEAVGYHNFASEKSAISLLEAKQFYGGHKWPTKTTWLRLET